MTDVSDNEVDEIPSEFRNLMNDFMGDILTSPLLNRILY